MTIRVESLKGQALALLENIKLGRKWPLVTNTLAYYRRKKCDTGYCRGCLAKTFSPERF